MPTPITYIEDAEDLIRSVPDDPKCHNADPATGALRLSASAFNDPDFQPSVDRSGMLTALDNARRAASHGLVKVKAHEARAVQIQRVENDVPVDAYYAVKPMHRPIDLGNSEGLPPNPAHALIECDPALNGSRFRKLKEKLAQIATPHGWISPPPRIVS